MGKGLMTGIAFNQDTDGTKLKTVLGSGLNAMIQSVVNSPCEG